MFEIIEPEALAQLLVAVAIRVARRAPALAADYDTDRAIAALRHEYLAFSQSEVIANVELRLLNGFADTQSVPEADAETIRGLMAEEMQALADRIGALPLD